MKDLHLVYKLMCHEVEKAEHNIDRIDRILKNLNYQKAIKFADDATKNRLQNYCTIVNDRYQKVQQEEIADRMSAITSQYRASLLRKESCEKDAKRAFKVFISL